MRRCSLSPGSVNDEDVIIYMLYFVWLLYLYSLMRLALVRCSALILEFDGSWRPSPRDPIPGFRSSQSYSSASASAALFLRSAVEDDVAEESLFAIGAKSLPDARTSADAEYEGLILGLEQVEAVLSSHDENAKKITPNDYELIIRGDCKAVIDQLNSRSNHRKTEGYYLLATEQIQQIKDCSPDIAITFEHIPREQNTLCDALCKLVLTLEQKRVVESVQTLVRMGEEECQSKQRKDRIKNTWIRSIKKKAFLSKSNYYADAIEEITNNSRICHSSRLALACSLSKSAIRTQDAVILNQLSAFFLQSSRTFTKIYWDDVGSSAVVTKDTLKRVGILCDLLTRKFVGSEQEAEQLRKKDKCIIFDKIEDVTKELNNDLDFVIQMCTKNNHEDVLFPYSVVTSKLIDGLINYHQWEWSRLANDFDSFQTATWLKIISL